jgi:dUTP pyrophosphatase
MSNRISVPIHVLDDELIPAYATPFASGCDARASIPEAITIAPGTSALVPTGIKVALPEGYEIQVRPRSGFAVKNQVTVLNTPGTIDSDYRGEICIILMNHGRDPFIVAPKMRIAQLVLAPVIQAEFIRHESLSSTQRGEGNFGHTGTN